MQVEEGAAVDIGGGRGIDRRNRPSKRKEANQILPTGAARSQSTSVVMAAGGSGALAKPEAFLNRAWAPPGPPR